MEELNGVPSPAITNGNGHHYYHQSSLPTNHRLRKPGRISRARALRDGARVSSEQVQIQQPPCTDFDMAYFHSYAHLSIHEEMIKAIYLPPLLACDNLYNSRSCPLFVYPLYLFFVIVCMLCCLIINLLLDI